VGGTLEFRCVTFGTIAFRRIMQEASTVDATRRGLANREYLDRHLHDWTPQADCRAALYGSLLSSKSSCTTTPAVFASIRTCASGFMRSAGRMAEDETTRRRRSSGRGRAGLS
jgi:hypothetical protein